MGAGKRISAGQALNGVGGQNLGIGRRHAGFECCRRNDAKMVAQARIVADAAGQRFNVLEARGKEKHFASFDFAPSRPDPGEPIKVDARVQRDKKWADVAEILKPQKPGHLSVGQLSIVWGDALEHVDDVDASFAGRLKRSIGYMPGPARLCGQCASEFDIVKRLQAGLCPQIRASTLPIVAAIGHNEPEILVRLWKIDRCQYSGPRLLPPSFSR